MCADVYETVPVGTVITSDMEIDHPTLGWIAANWHVGRKVEENDFRFRRLTKKKETDVGILGDPDEVLNIIEAFELGYHLGNVVKFMLSAGKKHDNTVQDLETARWYLDREIERRKKKGEGK